MTRERGLDELFAAWRAQAVPASKSAPDAEGVQGVARMLHQVAAKKRRRLLMRRTAAFLTLAAGVFGVALAGWQNLRGGAALAEGEKPPLVTPQPALPVAARPREVRLAARDGEVSITDANGAPSRSLVLAEGFGVRTQRGQARLDFPSGAAAEVGSGSSLELTRLTDDESLFLGSGRVDVQVPKLGAARGFSVQTPDTRVVVHGTRFSVSVEGAPPNVATRVSVTHGVVAVQQAGSEVLLGAGQSWPSAAVPLAAVPSDDGESLAPDASATHVEKSSAQTPAKRKARPRHSAESRALALQNQRFARAMDLKKQGDATGALSELERLLRRYPRSLLAQEARIERMRLFRSLGREASARAEAQRYLDEFGDGYAADEARALGAERP